MIKPSLSGFIFITFIIVMTVAGCANDNTAAEKLRDETIVTTPGRDTIINKSQEIEKVVTGFQTATPDSIVAFARTLIGTPYLYASTDPAKGFDCSGFITYVFNHFNITVPRSSVDFTNYGKEIAMEQSKPGDLILFTGTDSSIRIVGHMGFIESRQNDTLHFIHSTSGKAVGVMISPLGDYYKKRFVKVIRVFRDEFFK